MRKLGESFKEESNLTTEEVFIIQQEKKEEESKPEENKAEVTEKESSSQYGEDIFLTEYYSKNLPSQKLLVDIGAKGRSESNSYVLIKDFGWSGILVEPHPRSFKQLKEDFKEIEERVICTNLAVSTKNETKTLFMHEVPGHSSLIYSTVPADLNVANPGKKSYGLPYDVICISIKTLFYQFDLPLNLPLLLIDTEGMDTFIINDMLANTKIRPKILVWEFTTHHDSNRLSSQVCTRNLNDEGYKEIYRTTSNKVMALTT